MKNWLKEKWILIIGVAVALLCVGLLIHAASAEGLKAWASEPLSKLNKGDILLFILAHAFINRSEFKK